MFIGGLKRITLKIGVMYLINNNLVGEFINSTPKGFNFKKHIYPIKRNDGLIENEYSFIVPRWFEIKEFNEKKK